jgi:methionine-rich copper-binding protein CopC
VLAAVALASLLGATGALAHAFVDHAAPAVGSKVAAVPAEVTVWFTEELEPAFSGLRVEDAAGHTIAAADKAVDPSARSVLRLPLPRLAPGRYRVVWHVLSIDSHATEGDYTFEVVP